MVGDREQPFELAQDFYPIAKQCLKDRMLRETIDIVVRFATKKAASAGLKEGIGALFGDTAGDIAGLAGDAAGALTEKADTRNWQTLPATISYTRVPLKEGENKFVLKKYGPLGIDTDTLTIPYRKGLQIVNYFDLGRTQIVPVNNTDADASIAAATTTSKPQTLAESTVAVNTILQQSSKSTEAALATMDKPIAEKYDKWFDAGNGISYKVSLFNHFKEQDKEKYGKQVFFNNTSGKKVKVIYTITEKPFNELYNETSLTQYYEAQDSGAADKLYVKQEEKVKPEKETQGTVLFQTAPDFYITILKVE